jgi:hypothetical protein
VESFRPFDQPIEITYPALACLDPAHLDLRNADPGRKHGLLQRLSAHRMVPVGMTDTAHVSGAPRRLHGHVLPELVAKIGRSGPRSVLLAG